MAADVADLNPDFLGRLQAMINASGGQLTVNSGYRSVAEQAALWNASDKTGRTVAYPGTSMHNKGLAVDLGGNLDWAHQHAAEFGLYFPMSWEPWHIQPMGVGSGSAQTPMGQTPAPAQTHDPVRGLSIIADTLSTHAGAAPTVAPTAPSTENPMTTTTTAQQAQQPTAPQEAGGGSGGDVDAQLRAGFMRAGRSDLADMVGTKAFNAWVNAESGGNPSEVSPANNQGKANGGIFQFWAGHDWAVPYFQGGRFTMSPEEQAYNAATRFNLSPQRIESFANEIASGTYKGWG